MAERGGGGCRGRAYTRKALFRQPPPSPSPCRLSTGVLTMSTADDYQLLDFGDGRRLERFGRFVLDRPCPAAETFQRATPDLWTQADARFEGRDQERGQWTDRRELPERWVVACGPLRFELKRTEFGHLGLFPEQAENWDWIADVILSLGSRRAGGPPRPTMPAPLPKGEGTCAENPQSLRLHRREHAGGGGGRRGSGSCRCGEERRGLGAAKRGAFRLGRRRRSAGSPKTP